MKFSLFALVVILFAAVAYCATDGCPNEAVVRTQEFEDVPFEYVESTAPNSVCPDLNNQPSCCPPAIIAAVESAFNDARLQVIAAKQEMDAIRQQSSAIEAEFDALIDEINKKEADGEISSELADSIRSFVNDVKDAILKFIANVTTNFIRCLESILTYLAGIVCFACDTDSSQYVTVYSNNTVVVIVSEKTCDAMNGGCIALYLDFVQLVVDITEAYEKFYEALGLNIPDSETGWENPCYDGALSDDSTVNGEKCKDFICENLISGADIENPDFESTTEAKSSRSEEGMVARDVKAAKHGLAHSFATVKSLSGIELADSVLARAHSVLHSAQSAHARSRSALRATGTQTSTYSDNGVDIYAKGEASGLNKSASASMLSVATFLFGLVAVAALLF